MVRGLAMVVLGLAGCVPHATPVQSWRFEARPTRGEVRVLPVITTHDAPSLDTSSFLGRGLTPEVEAVRRARTRELDQVPSAIGLALPGAVNGVLGQTWRGQFRYAEWRGASRDRVERVLERDGRRLDAKLGRAARSAGGDAILVTWVSKIEGRALTADGFAGDIVETTAGSVVVDHEDEPYHVVVGVGMALVARDGEVVLRYQDSFEALLSSRMSPEHVGRVVASELASEVGKVWATDPEFEKGDPDWMAKR
ncbi:MAG: hypothetical protein ACI8PZ_000116 [Myxococcota bacterium]|jgi:hypothetical protein